MNGEKLYEGTYRPDTSIRKNSCGECIKLISGKIDSTWKFWDASGREYIPSKDELSKIQFNDLKDHFSRSR